MKNLIQMFRRKKNTSPPDENTYHAQVVYQRPFQDAGGDYHLDIVDLSYRGLTKYPTVDCTGDIIRVKMGSESFIMHKDHFIGVYTEVSQYGEEE